MKELLMHRGDCSFCTKLVHRDLLKEETDAEAVAKALAAKYEIDMEIALRDTEAYIRMLSEVGALA